MTLKRLAVAFAIMASMALLRGEGALEPGTLPLHWTTGGPHCAEIPDWQVHAYNEDFFIIRESGCTNYEKPFLYLIFGQDMALLEDTGAGDANTAAVIQRVMRLWMSTHQRASMPLLVCHSHGHADHTAGDKQLAALPGVRVIGTTAADVQRFFGITRWPEQIVTVDLGGRMLDVVPIPGHQPASIALYDRATGILLTGDTVYPGRLYVTDKAAFARSIERLIDFTKDKPVAHILGTHIEQSATPFIDYPRGTRYQPDEHSLGLSRGTLLELRDGLGGSTNAGARIDFRDFSIVPRN